MIRRPSIQIALGLLAVALVACGEPTPLEVPEMGGSGGGVAEAGDLVIRDGGDGIESVPYAPEEPESTPEEPEQQPVATTGTGRVEGTVYDERKQRVAGITVSVMRGDLRFDAVTDRRGFYRIANLPDGPWILMTERGEEFADAKVTTRRRRRVRMNLTLSRPLTALIRAEDDRGLPLAGVAIKLTSKGSTLELTTNEVGEAVTSRIRRDRRYRIGYTVEDHSYTSGPRSLRIKKDTSLVVAFERHVTLGGQVLDKDGEPVVDATVAVPGVEVKTDSEGRFEFAGKLPDPAWITAWDRTQERYAMTALEALPGEAEGDIVLELKPLGRVTATIVDARNRPVSGTLRLHSDDPRFLLLNRLSKKGLRSRFRTKAQDGVAVLERVPLDFYMQAHVAQNGFEGLRFERTPTPGQLEWDLGIVSLVERGSISGYVLDPDGKPRAAIVKIRASRNHRTARTGPDGRFRFTSLAAGAYDIVATPIAGKGDSRPRYQTGWVLGVRTGRDQPAEGVEVRMRDDVRVEGRVVNATGRPLQKLTMELVASEFPILGNRKARTGRDGRYKLAMPAMAEFNLHVRGADRLGIVPEPRPLRSGPKARLVEDFVIGAGAVVYGRITDPSGNPVKLDGIWFRHANRSTSISANAQGEYRSRPLKEGRHIVFVRSKYSLCARAEVVITREMEGREIRLDMRLGPAPMVSGYAVSRSGTPLVNTRIEGRGIDDPNVRREARTDAQGRFTLRGFYPGRYHIEIRRDRGSRQVLPAFAPGDRLTRNLISTRR